LNQTLVPVRTTTARAKRPVLCVLLGAIAVVSVAGCATEAATKEGRVSGLVASSPAYPLGNKTVPEPNATVEFVPTSTTGTKITTKTGSGGRYTVRIPAGSYEVHLVGYNPAQLYYGRHPETYGKWPRVTVVAGGEVELDLILDSGIR
jgi:hypothetical protein